MQAIDVLPTFVLTVRAAESAEGLGHLPRHRRNGNAIRFRRSICNCFHVDDRHRRPGAGPREAAPVLQPGGFLQFSLLRPCFVPPQRCVLGEADGTKLAIEVGEYFDTIDGRIDTFRFETIPQEEREKTEPFRVPRFYRTLSGWVSLISEAG